MSDLAAECGASVSVEDPLMDNCCKSLDIVDERGDVVSALVVRSTFGRGGSLGGTDGVSPAKEGSLARV